MRIYSLYECVDTQLIECVSTLEDYSTYRLLLRSSTAYTSSCSILQEGTTRLGRPTGRLGPSAALTLPELRRLSRMISPMSRVIGLTKLGASNLGKFWKIYAVRAVNEGQTSLRMFASTGKCCSVAHFLKLMPLTIIIPLRPL